MTTIKPTALYLTDDGRCYCGDHLGMNAKYTGRDISGQPIHRVTKEDVADAAYLDVWLACEQPHCGREAP